MIPSTVTTPANSQPSTVTPFDIEAQRSTLVSRINARSIALMDQASNGCYMASKALLSGVATGAAFALAGGLMMYSSNTGYKNFGLTEDEMMSNQLAAQQTMIGNAILGAATGIISSLAFEKGTEQMTEFGQFMLGRIMIYTSPLAGMITAPTGLFLGRSILDAAGKEHSTVEQAITTSGINAAYTGAGIGCAVALYLSIGAMINAIRNRS